MAVQFPDKDRWLKCTHEEKLMWSIMLLQQHIAGPNRINMDELPEKTQELVILGDFAIDDA